MGILKDIFGGGNKERDEYLKDVNSDCNKYTDEERAYFSYGYDHEGTVRNSDRKNPSDPY